MPIEIRMPALSPTMTEGNIARWLKKEGDEVHSGDIIAEIETDKATMEYEAVDEGRIGKIIVPEGTQGVKVNQPIAVLLEEGEDDGALKGFAGEPQPASDARQTKPPAATEPKTEPSPAPTAGQPALLPVAAPPGRSNGEGRIFASPLARRMAQHAGIDIATIRGSGPQGRIVKADIEAALGKGGVVTPTAGASQPQAMLALPSGPSLSKEQVIALAGNPPYTERPHTGMRRTIARRLTQSKQTIPHFYMSVDCRIDELLAGRVRLNGNSETKISVNDFVIRAAAFALRKVPATNASWSEDAILQWDRVDIAVAVALDEGLITPIIRNADQKGLSQIAGEMKDLAARARAGKLKIEEFQGGTFSISNLGMYGIREFAAVINPPHGAILAVGAGEQRAIVRDGQVVVANVMTCTLSCDHRVVDGAVGAQFLAAFKGFIEDPLSMLL